MLESLSAKHFSLLRATYTCTICPSLHPPPGWTHPFLILLLLHFSLSFFFVVFYFFFCLVFSSSTMDLVLMKYTHHKTVLLYFFVWRSPFFRRAQSVSNAEVWVARLEKSGSDYHFFANISKTNTFVRLISFFQNVQTSKNVMISFKMVFSSFVS